MAMVLKNILTTKNRLCGAYRSMKSNDFFDAVKCLEVCIFLHSLAEIEYTEIVVALEPPAGEQTI